MAITCYLCHLALNTTITLLHLGAARMTLNLHSWPYLRADFRELLSAGAIFILPPGPLASGPASGTATTLNRSVNNQPRPCAPEQMNVCLRGASAIVAQRARGSEHVKAVVSDIVIHWSPLRGRTLVLPAHLAHGLRTARGEYMWPGTTTRVVVPRKLSAEALLELGGDAPPGRSVRPHPFEEQVSPATSRAVDEESLRAGRVPRRVDQLDRQTTAPTVTRPRKWMH